MGKKAREIVELNVDELIEDLNRALADEWIAVFYYTHAANIAKGMNSPIIADALKKTADEEREHAQELTDRIIQLGGTPIGKFEDLAKKANCPSVDLPKDAGDLNGIAKAIVEAERCAIDVYNKLLKKIMPGKDTVTTQVIRHIISEEIEHEDLFETLLGL